MDLDKRLDFGSKSVEVSLRKRVERRPGDALVRKRVPRPTGNANEQQEEAEKSTGSKPHALTLAAGTHAHKVGWLLLPGSRIAAFARLKVPLLGARRADVGSCLP